MENSFIIRKLKEKKLKRVLTLKELKDIKIKI